MRIISDLEFYAQTISKTRVHWKHFQTLKTQKFASTSIQWVFWFPFVVFPIFLSFSLFSLFLLKWYTFAIHKIKWIPSFPFKKNELIGRQIEKCLNHKMVFDFSKAFIQDLHDNLLAKTTKCGLRWWWNCYVDSWPIRGEGNLGVHLIQSSHFTVEKNKSPKEKGTYLRKTVSGRQWIFNKHLLLEWVH